MEELKKKIIANWLIIGLVMVYFQVLLGGITRLTGSGLSITEWNVIMGAFPPMSEIRWQELFDKYKQFPQYRLMNSDMDLAGFKSIFLWEYVHRLWGRTFGIVFLIPFVFFVIKKWIDRKLMISLSILFCLGILEATVGWIMVKSGLVDMPWVNPVKLGLHLIIACFILSYLLRIIVFYSDSKDEAPDTPGISKWLNTLVVLTFIQIFLGALMAGHHAALSFPTWPLIGQEWIPSTMFTYQPLWANIFENVAMIHFLHRGVAYILAIAVFIFWFTKRKHIPASLFKKVFYFVPLVVLIQVLLGIITILSSQIKIPVGWAALHQGVAIIMLLVLLYLRFSIAQSKQKAGLVSA